jgi:allatostatin receptor
MDAGVTLLSNMTLNGTNCTGACAEESDDGASNNYFDRIISIVLPIVYGIVVIVGVVGNLLVIVVVVNNKQMRNTTNILIIGLAIADLSFIIICVPFTAISYTVPYWPFGVAWCKIVQYMNFVTAYVSIYTLVLMSFDRYLAVVHAIAAMSFRSERNAYICVIITWVVLLSVNIPVCFVYNVFEYEYNNETRAACVPDHTKKTDMFTTFFVFGYMLPLSLIIILYGFMLKRLLYGITPGVSQSAESMRSRRRVTKMVVIVVVIFALSWLPNHIVFMYLSYRPHPGTIGFVAFMTISQILCYGNSCVNPILYAFLSENFRKGFRRILCMGSKHASRMDFERTNTRPLLTGATTLRSLGPSTNENGL